MCKCAEGFCISVCVCGSHRVLGDEARETLSMAELELAQASVNLGEQYCRLSTGQSHVSLHHTCQGR